MKKFCLSTLLLLAAAGFAPAADAPKAPINLLFIMTDQQRWNTMGCMGNKVIKTPNFDRLARDGARFTNMYSSCPVCVPARTTILTGHSCSSTHVLGNNDVNKTDLPFFQTFDQVLMSQGYRGEYYGKWHSPYMYALEYENPVKWVNGPKPPGSRAELPESLAFLAYLDKNVPKRPLQPGELLANMYDRPYRPDPLDGAYGKTPEEVKALGHNKESSKAAEIGQGFTYGCLDVPPEHTLTAWTVKDGLEALDRLKDGPFTLTVSIGPPHPPMVLPKPYYGMYPAKDMMIPPSNDDPRDDSPYLKSPNAPPSMRDKDKVRQMISDYYGLITLDDDWIGKLLDKLDELKLSDHTLVIFTADHGEMLGDHGMMSKFVFFEGSVHIPLLMRLPGVIRPGTVVTTPVAQIDLFSTILDYCNLPGYESEGASLRPLLEGRQDGPPRFVVSEWPQINVPGYMVFDGQYKFLCGRGLLAHSVDALYDLGSDPFELHNLLAADRNPERSMPQAEKMRGLLVSWLEKIKSPAAEEVKKRTLGASKP